MFLDIKGNTYPSIELNMNSRGTAASYSSGWKYIRSMVATQIHMPYDGNVLFRRAASGSADGDITWSESMRITSGGDVLISDTTNSVYNDASGGGINLKANGQIVNKKEATSTADPLVWLNDTGQTTNRTIALAQDGTERGYLGLTGTNLSLGVNGGDRLLITDAGMVGINMTPSTVGSSTYMLQMYNAGTQCFMSLGQGSGNGPLNGLVIGISNAAHYITGREKPTYDICN